jgi:copper(I)-binding protein
MVQRSAIGYFQFRQISMRRIFSGLFMVLAVTVLVAGADARTAIAADAGTISAHDAWARASAGNATTGAAYVVLQGGTAADELRGISTPIAEKADVHESITDNGVMTMRAVPSLPIPAGKAVALAPSGLHIMLTGLKQKMIAGQSFPMTLTFAQAAPVTVTVAVLPLGRAAQSHEHDHMH